MAAALALVVAVVPAVARVEVAPGAVVVVGLARTSRQGGTVPHTCQMATGPAVAIPHSRVTPTWRGRTGLPVTHTGVVYRASPAVVVVGLSCRRPVVKRGPGLEAQTLAPTRGSPRQTPVGVQAYPVRRGLEDLTWHQYR
jgi:hypothetical protein